MGLDLNGIEVEVEKIMKTEPRRISRINLFFHIPEHLKVIDESKKDVLKHIAHTCPVAQSISPEIKVHVDWNW
jgi:putative redox protein